MYLNYLIPAIALLVLVIWIVKVFFDTFSLFFKYHSRNIINKYFLFQELQPEYKLPIEARFSYYQSLNVADKKLFERRVQKFINKKVFVPRGDLNTVTPEMKALIAASAIQITFGYPSVYFEYFWRILVYPDQYYSKITRLYHKGEVSTKGFIILSWENFEKGYEDGTDGRNLGLHEMAHALQLENSIVNFEYDFIDFEALKAYDIEARKEIDKIRLHGSDFFRSYAATNRVEFFAVSVENFFERPGLFKAYNSVLYDLLTMILLQDPLKISNGITIEISK